LARVIINTWSEVAGPFETKPDVMAWIADQGFVERIEAELDTRTNEWYAFKLQAAQRLVV
jgi:hypothetical protein